MEPRSHQGTKSHKENYSQKNLFFNHFNQRSLTKFIIQQHSFVSIDSIIIAR